MNPLDILKYGEATWQASLERIPAAAWERDGVCGWWSIKHIIAHLASYEVLLEEILSGFTDQPIPAPLTSELGTGGPYAFNDAQVGLRETWSVAEVVREYQTAHQRALAVAQGVPPEIWSQVGTLPWYGADYALDDFIVYSYYGHKREHSAHVDVFADRLKEEKKV